jgi:integrase
MSYRQKRNGTWVVEIYDPKLKRKAHVRPRDHGMEPPRSERQAKALERAALNARDSRRAGAHDETCRSFAERWPDEYGGRGRGESTREHNRERVRLFGAPPAGDAPDDAPDFSDRSLRSITREEGRTWAAQHPSMVPALRAMFNDAIRDKLADENPFAKLGLEQTKGREDITVLTRDEITLLGETSLAVYGPDFGREFAAMIAWQAFTCVRTGETFATRYSLLEGDTYHLRKQWNSRLRKETAPKYNGVGTIYVPEPAQRAVLDKPRRLGDDLMFRTKRGKQFRQESLHRWWMPVRAAFMAKLPPGHHLHERLALDPDDGMDFYELRHFGASYMLNVLGLEPWVIAEQLRHADGGILVVKLYGHPSREEAIGRMRRAYTARVEPIRGIRSSEPSAAGGKLGGPR